MQPAAFFPLARADFVERLRAVGVRSEEEIQAGSPKIWMQVGKVLDHLSSAIVGICSPLPAGYHAGGCGSVVHEVSRRARC